jgi:hypothetical protein
MLGASLSSNATAAVTVLRTMNGDIIVGVNPTKAVP